MTRALHADSALSALCAPCVANKWLTEFTKTHAHLTLEFQTHVQKQLKAIFEGVVNCIDAVFQCQYMYVAIINAATYIRKGQLVNKVLISVSFTSV